MTPTEKAAELIAKYVKLQVAILFTEAGSSCIAVGNMLEKSAVKCAILAVNEILELSIFWIDESLVRDYPKKYKPEDTCEFWEEVLEILEKK